VAALPDRLVYAFRIGGARGTRICSKPFFPLEPLVFGGITLPKIRTSAIQKVGSFSSGVGPHINHSGPPIKSHHEAEDSGAASTLLRSIVERYSPPASASELGGVKYGPAEGPGRNAGATIRTCVALCEAGLFDLAAVAAGVTTDATAQGAEAYRKRPWISPEVKAGIAAASTGWTEAMAEELAEDPSTQDYAVNPNSFQNANLPSRYTKTSRALAAVGDDARLCGQFESALRLYDASGEDEEVIYLLLLHATYQGHTEADNLLKEVLRNKSIPLLQSLAALLGLLDRSQLNGESFVGDKLGSTSFPFASQRRSSLLPSTPGQELTSFAIERHEKPKDIAVLGPPACSVRKLLLDRVEEWVGQVKPEVVEDDVGEEGGVGGGGEGASSEEWVKGVGQGREEEDNMVGYWRFSELTPVEGGPASQLNGDLSNYSNVLELVMDRAGAITFEESTSLIDPGDGVKVRPAFDACFSSAELTGKEGSAKCRRAMAIRFKRGAALDVGAYHSQLGRTKLTLELWVLRPEEATVGDPACGGLHTLITRTTDDDGVRLWTLAIDKDGALIFHAGEDWTALGDTDDVRTSAGMIETGKWYHVAVVMECKGRQGAQASVSLYVHGKEVVNGTVRLPAVTEAKLRNQAMLIG